MTGSDKKHIVVSDIQPLMNARSSESRVTIEQYNKEIDDAVARVASDDYYTREEVEELAKEC